MFLLLSGVALCKAYVLRSIGGGHEISDIQDDVAARCFGSSESPARCSFCCAHILPANCGLTALYSAHRFALERRPEEDDRP